VGSPRKRQKYESTVGFADGAPGFAHQFRGYQMAGKELTVTPGEMLKEEFLAPYGPSQNQLAKAIGISPNRIAEIVNNRRRITADTALRLGLYFGNSPEFWMNLQTHYDLKMARRNLKSEDAKAN
jgi:antitoxin HigA-1